MSEVAEDLQATDATPVTPSDTAGAVPVAGDLFDSDSADTAAFVDEETSEASAFDPDTTDWLRVNPDEVPEQYRPLSGIARNMQAQFTRTQQDAKDRLRQADTTIQQNQSQQSQIQALQAQLAAYQQPAQPAVADQWMQNLSEDEQRGVGIVDWRAEEKVNAVVGPLLQKVQILEQQVATHNADMQQRGQRHYAAQITEAETAYSADEVDHHRQMILTNVNNINPATGANYTVKEVMDMVTGTASSNAAQARQNDEEVRKTSKSSARTRTSASPSSTDDGPLSQGDLMAEMAKLGFD